MSDSRFLLVSLILCSGILVAQKIKTEVVFSDGSKKIGLAKMTNDNVGIMFRGSKKDKKEFISINEVDTLKMYYSEKPTFYAKTRIKGLERGVLMHVSLPAKEVFLYTDFNSANVPITVSSSSLGGSRIYNVANYYLRKDGDKEATYIGNDQTSFKKLEMAMTPFFNNCASLMEKIRARDYSRKKIWKLIPYYDEQCVQPITDN